MALAIGALVSALLSSSVTRAAVYTAGGYTTSATAAPSSVTAGGATVIAASVTSDTTTTALIDIEVYDANGAKAHQQYFDSQSLTAGVKRDFTTTWQTPANAAAGGRTVKIGVFAPGWAGMRHWNDNAATVTVTASTTTSTPTATASSTPPPTSLPALPAGWPATLQLGLASPPGDAAAMKATTNFGFRYQYLAGGVNTGNGWANWNSGGQFVTYYVQDSLQNGITPVFSYYMIFQSLPGSSQGEAAAVYTNLNTTATMTAYYNDLKLFFQRAGAFPSTKVVLHVEPDMWGYMQQRATSDNAASVSVKVAATGLAEVAGLPDNLSGFARAVVKLRDAYAPNVMLGYHISDWGTGTDISLSNPPDPTVDSLGTRAANFYLSLQTNFDIAFSEFSDRDSGFYQYVYGDGGASWFDAGDFGRHARFLAMFVNVARKRVVIWQIPLGNTKMRAMNNTTGHYQDNRPEWFLDDPSRAHFNDYVAAGVVAFLFGGGASGTTCACDAMNDGVTNPAAINGNTATSLSADDDGGFFRQKAKDYYGTGAIPLPGGSAPPPPTVTPTATPSPTPTATASPTATPSPTPTTTPPAAWTTSASVSPSTVARGGKVSITASVASPAAQTVLVDVEVYAPNGARVHQQFYQSQTFTAGQRRQYTTSWSVPANAVRGTYRVKIGIFSPNWGTLYQWNDNARQFTVQ